MADDLGFDWRDVETARGRLRGVARMTPLVEASELEHGERLYLKAESLQRTHAFKFRGAYNRVSLMAEAQLRAGLVTASSGNHGLGLSLAGRLKGAAVTVVMPERAPEIKAQGCRGHGATVVRWGQTYDEALARARAIAVQQGLCYVPSFDDPLVAAGQATVAWEIIEQLPEVDVIVAPVGGGGLLSGILGLLHSLPAEVAARAFPGRRRPLSEILVVGVQAAGAASMVESVRSGSRLELPSIATVADGIAVRQPGAWTYEVVRRYADYLVTVADGAILNAVGRLAVREKLVAEPAGAAAVAAVLGAPRTECAHGAAPWRNAGAIACVVSGGNVDQALLAECVAGQGGR